jgi:hypothetical protein
MSAALVPPFVIASLLLCVAGVMKLRSSGGAMRALGVGEVALGVACAVHPTRALAAALALTYMSFAAVAVILRRRRMACGCFGDNDFPVSLAHVIASELLGTLGLAAALAGPHGLGWVLSQPAPQAAALLIGIAGAVYATMLVYTLAPRAWLQWSGE